MSNKQWAVALAGIGFLFGIASVAATGETVDAIEQAKAVVKSHEEFVLSGDLDGVMSNFADDAVVLAGNVPLQVGKAAIRSMYAAVLKASPARGEHEYEGGVALGELVFLHGVFRAPANPQAQRPALANNFILTFRKGTDGKYRFWRAAFAPAGK